MKRSKEIWLEWQQKEAAAERAARREHWDNRRREMTVDDVRELTVLRYLAFAVDEYFPVSQVVDETSQTQHVKRMQVSASLNRWKIAAGEVTDPDEMKPYNREWRPLATRADCDKCGAAVSPATLTCGDCGAKR